MPLGVFSSEEQSVTLPQPLVRYCPGLEAAWLAEHHPAAGRRAVTGAAHRCPPDYAHLIMHTLFMCGAGGR